MSRMAALRLLLGVVSAALFTIMIWLGETRIAPLVPNGDLLQAQVFGYDTHRLVSFMSALKGNPAEATYKAILQWLDAGFITTYAAFVFVMLWPHRRLALTLALLYAGLDLAENISLLQALAAIPQSTGTSPPASGTWSLTGVITALKYATLLTIALTVIWRWTKARHI
ncbi:MAG: hypothetical protein GKR98_01195 [Boseongicola sp.]|nr:MAG: hypothetical protein GKR98_01195 [Boseongicola sp.]